MLNQNKLQNSINNAYFDQISQIEVKNVEVDFEVDRLFSEYQMPPKKTKLKTPGSLKNNCQQKKTSESTMSTKERSKNEEDSTNIEKHHQLAQNQNNMNSLKKNHSKKILFINNQHKTKVAENPVKKTARKKTVYSEFQKIGETYKKIIKSPQPTKISRKVSKVKDYQEKCRILPQSKKCDNEQKQEQQVRKSRHSCDSNKNMSSRKKSRSQSIMSGSRQRLSSKACIQPNDKQKEDNRKLIMRDYFGEDEEETNKKKFNGNQADLRNIRSCSKYSKDQVLPRQRVESKLRQMMIGKSRERVGSKSKERVLVFSAKNRKQLC